MEKQIKELNSSFENYKDLNKVKNLNEEGLNFIKSSTLIINTFKKINEIVLELNYKILLIKEKLLNLNIDKSEIKLLFKNFISNIKLIVELSTIIAKLIPSEYSLYILFIINSINKLINDLEYNQEKIIELLVNSLNFIKENLLKIINFSLLVLNFIYENKEITQDFLISKINTESIKSLLDKIDNIRGKIIKFCKETKKKCLTIFKNSLDKLDDFFDFIIDFLKNLLEKILLNENQKDDNGEFMKEKLKEIKTTICNFTNNTILPMKLKLMLTSFYDKIIIIIENFTMIKIEMKKKIIISSYYVLAIFLQIIVKTIKIPQKLFQKINEKIEIEINEKILN
jgi:hypothetical protein